MYARRQQQLAQGLMVARCPLHASPVCVCDGAGSNCSAIRAMTIVRPSHLSPIIPSSSSPARFAPITLYAEPLRTGNSHRLTPAMSLRPAAFQSLRSATRFTPRLTPFLSARSYADSASQPITEELIKAKLVEALKPSHIQVIDTSGKLSSLSGAL
jgi:hypothetical protein